MKAIRIHETGGPDVSLWRGGEGSPGHRCTQNDRENDAGGLIDEKFYILSHPEGKARMRTRMEDILQERNPTYIPVLQ